MQPPTLGHSSQDLLLDPSIRNWGVLPILVFVLCINLLRVYLTHLGKSNKAPELDDLRRRQTLARADRLRAHGNYIHQRGFNARKAWFVDKEKGEGVLLEEGVPGAVNPMSNPMGMMEMVKGQAYFGMTQMGMMQFSEMFFSGFVLVKIPFALTTSFKGMLQRGIELSTLDASYVSATSWMFLVAFGVKDLQRLFAYDEAPLQEEARVYAQQLGGVPVGGGPPAPMGFDCAKMFVAAKEGLEVIRHRYALEEVEKRVLRDRYPTTLSATGTWKREGGREGGRGHAPFHSDCYLIVLDFSLQFVFPHHTHKQKRSFPWKKRRGRR